MIKCGSRRSTNQNDCCFLFVQKMSLTRIRIILILLSMHTTTIVQGYSTMHHDPCRQNMWTSSIQRRKRTSNNAAIGRNYGSPTIKTPNSRCCMKNRMFDDHSSLEWNNKIATSSTTSKCPSTTTPISRRELTNWIVFTTTAVVVSSIPPLSTSTASAETVGKDPNCNDRTCLGVWDGLFADCPPFTKNRFGFIRYGCVSTQDDTPGVFAEPWDYYDDNEHIATLDTKNRIFDDKELFVTKRLMDRLIDAIQTVSSETAPTTTRTMKQQDNNIINDNAVTLLIREGRYLRVLFVDGEKQQQQTSIGEFYFTPNDTTVQFRISAMPPDQTTTTNNKNMFASSFLSSSSAGVVRNNKDRAERIRKQLGFQTIPVLRNRKRTLFFVESEYDTFGPGSAALGPPAEMEKGEIDYEEPPVKVDWLQGFPMVLNSK